MSWRRHSSAAERAVGLLLGFTILWAPRARAAVEQDLQRVAIGVKAHEEKLRLVEEGFVAHLQAGNEQSLQERFGEAEVAYLIGDFSKATSLLYDVVLTPAFHSSERYFDGLFYLGESLRQQKDYLGAKHFLRELLERGPSADHFQDALVSYLDVAARTNDFRDLDRYAALAERSGRLAPMVEYLLAKALFERTDLADTDRIKGALAAFRKIGPSNPFYLQSVYFVGVCLVQLGELSEARDAFATVTNAPVSDDAVTRQLRELAFLSIGRVEYERGQYAEALDAYQNVPETSASFYDALYEIAWTYVRKGDFESARKAVELLTLGAPESTLLPEANLLRGQLLLKLGKYEDSEDTYQQVVGKYGPVRDQIDRLLTVNGDPAAYFDKLVAQKGGSFDVTSLLPTLVRSFATSQKAVREAQAVARDLGDGRRGITESDEIVARIEKRMVDATSMHACPALPPGTARAGTGDAALLADERQPGAIERDVLGATLSAGEQAELQELARQGSGVEARFVNLPTNEAQQQGRDAQRLAILKEREKELFKLSLLVQSLKAQGQAVQRLADDTRPQRNVNPDDERKFADEVSAALTEVEGYDGQLGSMLRELRDAEGVDTATGQRSDEGLRAAYASALQREADLLAAARGRAPAEAAAKAQEVQALRDQVAQLRARCATAIGQIRDAAVAQTGIIRQKLSIETQNLDGYRQEVATAEGNAGGLVGRIAYESFKRVRRQVYDLVLKADVGIVDVAWTKKHDDTDKIQKLASDKDRELRTLDDDFHEVLGEIH